MQRALGRLRQGCWPASWARASGGRFARGLRRAVCTRAHDSPATSAMHSGGRLPRRGVGPLQPRRQRAGPDVGRRTSQLELAHARNAPPDAPSPVTRGSSHARLPHHARVAGMTPTGLPIARQGCSVPTQLPGWLEQGHCFPRLSFGASGVSASHRRRRGERSSPLGARCGQTEAEGVPVVFGAPAQSPTGNNTSKQ